MGGVYAHCIDDHFHETRMDDKRDDKFWTVVQKKSASQKLSGDYRALETIPPADDIHLLVHDTSVNREKSVDQSGDINSLIGTPFIIPSHVANESRVDDSGKNDSIKLKSRHPAEAVRGLLRIGPAKGKKDAMVATNKKEGVDVIDVIDIGQIDWPSITGSHRDDKHTAGGERDGKSWSTALKTVPLPKPMEKV